MFFRRFSWVVICAAFLVASCAPGTPGPTPVVVTLTPVIDQVFETAVPMTPKPGNGCQRPYSEYSLWNMPVDWSVARIHPDNDLMMEAFFRDDNWIGSDTSQYSANLYYVNNQTPHVAVKLQPGRSYRNAIDDTNIQYGQPGGTVLVPLPPDARPAPGTDGELAVINTDTGEEWGIIDGRILDVGQWAAGGVYRYHILNSGIPPKGFAQRGAGIGHLAGLVRPCEVQRGFIGHAVTIAYDFPCAPAICQDNGWPEVIPPFTKTDGRGTEQFDIPEGARLVVKPEIRKEEIVRACSGMIGCIVWVQNMQEYGGFLVDNSGHPKTYAEGDASANWDKNVWSAEMLRNIPSDWYAVLDWNSPAISKP